MFVGCIVKFQYFQYELKIHIENIEIFVDNRYNIIGDTYMA